MTTVERRLFAGLALWSIVLVSRGSPALGGDATYYLAVADSIARDRDLDLRNQFAADGGYVFQQDAERSFTRATPDGPLVPSQGLGLSAALAPVLVAARGAAGALPDSLLSRVRWTRDRAARDLVSLAMALLAAWLAVLTLRLTARLSDRRRLWMPVAFAFATPPLLLAAIQAVPEVPAAALLVWFVLDVAGARPRAGRAALALALLPWLHLRFALVTVAGVVWLWRLADRRAAFLPIASLAACLAATWALTAVPPTQLAGEIASAIGSGLIALPGLVTSPDSGLLWVAPFWLVALAGIGRIGGAHRAMARFVAWSLAGIAVMAGMFDSGQAAPAPGLLLAPILPLLVPFLAEGFAAMASGWRRWATGLFVAWSIVVLMLIGDRPRRLLAEPGHGVGRLPQQALGWVAQQRAPARRLAKLGFSVDHAGLLAAVRGGHVEAVGLFVEHGVATGEALLAAVQSGQPDSLSRLVQDGAVGPDAARALAWAKHYERESLAAILTRAGTAIDAQAPSGETALMTAVRLGRAEDRAVLLGQGADVNVAARNGETALMMAAQRGDARAVSDLLAAGADVGARDLDGWTPLLFAARFAHRDAVHLLLEHGADPNVRSRIGWTALMWASDEGAVEIVARLLDRGADVNASGQAGGTPLIRAAARGHGDVVTRLLAAGADAAARVDGRDARAWAEAGGHAAVVDILARGRQP